MHDRANAWTCWQDMKDKPHACVISQLWEADEDGMQDVLSFPTPLLSLRSIPFPLLWQGFPKGWLCHNQIFSAPQAGASFPSTLRLAQTLHMASEGPLLVKARGTEGAAQTRNLAAGSPVSQGSLSLGRCGVAVTTVVVLVLSRNFWFGCQSVWMTDLKQNHRAQPGMSLLNGSGQVGRHRQTVLTQSIWWVPRALSLHYCKSLHLFCPHHLVLAATWNKSRRIQHKRQLIMMKTEVFVLL